MGIFWRQRAPSGASPGPPVGTPEPVGAACGTLHDLAGNEDRPGQSRIVGPTGNHIEHASGCIDHRNRHSMGVFGPIRVSIEVHRPMDTQPNKTSVTASRSAPRVLTAVTASIKHGHSRE